MRVENSEQLSKLLAKWKRVEILDFANISNGDLELAASIDSLRKIDLEAVAVNATDLGTLPANKLECLTLGKVKNWSDGLRQVRRLNLNEIKIRGSSLSQEKDLSNLFAREAIDLEGTQLKNEQIATLRRNDGVLYLNLGGTCVSEGIGQLILTRFPNLQRLAIGSDRLTDNDFRHFSQLKNLEELWIDEARAIGSQSIHHLRSCSRLKALTFWSCGGINDDAISHLLAIKSLDELTLRDVKVTYDGIKKLRKRLAEDKIAHDHFLREAQEQEEREAREADLEDEKD